MADRPQPPQERRTGHELGTGGDQDIVKGPPARDDEIFVRVATAENPFEADLLATALAEAEIPVAVRAQKDHLLDPLVNPNVPFWTVMVPDRFAAEAERIVAARQAELRAEAEEAGRAAEEEEAASEA